LTLINAVVIALGVGFTPWFESKNFLPGAVVGLGFVAVAVRRRLPIRAVGGTVGLIAISWVLLIAYNLHYFGHLLGFPEPRPSLNGQGALQVLALLLDRHQGLFVQVPTVALGVVGLWFARHTVPIAAVVTLVATAGILILNGTYVSNPFGGTVLAGRFEWSALPMLLAWSPYVLKRIDFRKSRTIATATVIVLLWIVQAVPIFDAEHYHFGSYFNAFVKGLSPWDPSLYPGWWPGVNNLLPALFPPTDPNRSLQMLVGWSGVHVLAIVGLLVLVCTLLLWMSRPTSLWPDSMRRLPTVSKIGGVAVGMAIVLIVLGVALPNRDLPGSALHWTGADLGSPFVAAGRSVRSSDLPLARGDTGVYTSSLSYTLVGNSSSGTLSMLRRPLGEVPPGAWTPASTTRLSSGNHTVSVTFQLPPSEIGVRMGAGRGSTLVVHDLLLTKRAAVSAS
jgi:hypothetical protein